MLLYWRVMAVVDIGLAAFNVFMALFMWNWVSYMNLLAAVICASLGVFSEHQYRRRRASRDEEARIKHIQDNFPWI